MTKYKYLIPGSTRGIDIQIMDINRTSSGGMNMEFVFLILIIAGIIVTIIFSFLQVIVHFREWKLKFSERYPFDRCQGEAGRAIRRKMI